MNTINTLILLFTFGFLTNVQSQETKATYSSELKSKNNLSYYQTKGEQDAELEKKFKASSRSEERAFWKEQEQYEKNLKKENKRAYRVYVQSKNDAYAAHFHSCSDHCHHSDYWYQHAGYYYYEYRQPKNEYRPLRTTVNTHIGVSTPRVGVGLF
jgi:hypothetical protein